MDKSGAKHQVVVDINRIKSMEVSKIKLKYLAIMSFKDYNDL